MQIVLLYPPPWKIAPDGNPPYPPGEGPPAETNTAAARTGDFIQIPYGLLSLAAQSRHAGDDVRVFNLANFSWPVIEGLIAHLEADLFGLSCMTGNRRGTAMLAALIRSVHPGVHIVVGGPHVTALPLEMLQHVPAIDTVVIGEGEQTFAEIIACWKKDKPLKGIPGTAWRDGLRCRLGPPRDPMEHLDALVSPLDYFDLGTVMTSRGCPMHCTFCSSTGMWGPRPRFHSVEYVLRELETAVCRHGRRMLSIKDDTFTAHRARTLAICEGIRQRGLEFIWSCDTRVDCLDDDLLAAMRRAGCVRISLGVESGSPKVLKNIRKRISPETVLASTRAAQKVGLQVRYYMMAGNRGETLQTFQQSLDLIAAARPNQFVFSQLHLYPGTEEFEIFRRQGLVSPEIFFQRDFLCLSCFAGAAGDERAIRDQLQRMEGVQNYRDYSVEERRGILARMSGLHLCHMDLARAWLREGNAEAAEIHLQRALCRGYFLPGLVYNLLACICAFRSDPAGVESNLERAAACYPHRVVLENQGRLDNWLVSGGRHSGITLALDPGDGWESTCICRQPEFPDLPDLEVQGFLNMAKGYQTAEVDTV
jgi:radical SAM superfamily enzyme YgiQ (UPF0313 family)